MIMKRGVTIILLLLLFIVNTSFYGSEPSPDAYRIVIRKHAYELVLYDAQGWLATYPVVFGNKDLKDKMVEGDRETPEGNFRIKSKRVHEKWCRMLMLDFPNEESIQKFNARKQQGLIPSNAKIGGGVGIHGTWPREDFAVDRYDNWTLGCISMKNADVIELFNTIPVGTRVSIQK
jgi:lipoprotein-anchoring transpeptidase ErfK/SrfK